ncbi:MAG: pyruvate kinase [Gammaproteobacteria bacterium]|nr:pyruvate kinase [Gammaproteobacteria bacterium]
MKKSALLSWRRTKIIATLGPASNSEQSMAELLASGVNVVRLNMSHGDHDQHRVLFKRVRAVAERLAHPVAILMDLCGPKIRVGEFVAGGIELREGETVQVTTRKVFGTHALIPISYAQLHEEVSCGERILLDDGKLELQVLSVVAQEIRCRVIYGGELKDHKGVNLPDSELRVPSFTHKDRLDAALAAELGADYLALSFVRDCSDVLHLKNHLMHLHADIPVIAKIEKPEAVENIVSILQHSDGIMIARGDLGIELPAEQIPFIQQRLIYQARRYYKPVIVATQMLESMINSARATRAEVGDVASAAMSSADAVMLSGETAMGAYPLQAVQTMDRVLRETERHQWQSGQFGPRLNNVSDEQHFPLRTAVAHAVVSLAEDLKLQSLVVPTRNGTTARVLAAERPTAPLIGVCSSAVQQRRLSLLWGVVPMLASEEQREDWLQLRELISHTYLLEGDGNTVLLVTGFSDDPQLNQPVMKVVHL